MKSINTSLFDFPTLRDPQSNYVYVDKTAQLYEIAKPTADRIYYLPRPRRFGKSLMLSTLKALFEGRRELFKGLAIEKTDWDWEKEVYPVLHLDMSTVASKTNAELEVSLQDLIQGLGARFGAPFDLAKPAKTNFKNVLAHLASVSPNGKYVVLIDEYDAPIAGLLDTPEGREELRTVRKTLHDFYVQAKALAAEGVGEKFVTLETERRGTTRLESSAKNLGDQNLVSYARNDLHHACSNL